MDLLKTHDRDLDRPAPAPAAAACGETTSLAAELKDVERILSARFGSSLNAHDYEDLCQDAFASMLAYAAKGNQVDNRRAFLTTVAVRAAIKLCSRAREQAADPAGGIFDREDLAADTDERLQSRADLVWLAEALDSLTDLERLVYQSHHIDELDPPAAVRKLQISRATYYRRLRSASTKLGGMMTSERRIGSRERDLIERYVAGTARRSEVRRAERLIAADPLCSAVAREISQLHRGAAMLLPPALFVPAHGGILAMLTAAVSALRDRIFGAPDSAAGGGVAAGGGGAASGGGALAAIGGAKAVAICAAGGIAACGIGGLAALERPDLDSHPASSPAPISTPLPVGDGLASASRDLAAAARTASSSASDKHRGGSSSGAGKDNGSDKASDPAAATDSAPAAATPTETAGEFDPLVSGSPASASPSPSGSSTSGGVAAGSEFGP